MSWMPLLGGPWIVINRIISKVDILKIAIRVAIAVSMTNPGPQGYQNLPNGDAALPALGVYIYMMGSWMGCQNKHPQ